MDICRTINNLEWEIKSAHDKENNMLQELAQSDLLVGMLNLTKQYGKDYASNPEFKASARELLEKFETNQIQWKLLTENKKILDTSHLEKSIANFHNDLERFLIDKDMTWSGNPGSTFVKVLRFLSKNYKLNTLGPAMGRVIFEPIQAAITTGIIKLDEITSFQVPENMKWKMPNWGKLDKTEDYAKREYWNGYGIYWANMLQGGEMFWWKFLNAVGQSLINIQSWIISKPMGAMENVIFQSIADKMFIQKSKIKWNEWMTKDLIAEGNKIKLSNTINEIKRKATAEAKKLFFNYVDNPLLVHKLGEYLPFANYMYSGIRLMSRYPKSFMFLATALDNAQYTYWEEVWYIDDDGQRIDDGIKLRFGALAAVWLWNVQLNVGRIMSASPTSTTLSPIPIFSYLTNREDPRWKKFYDSGSVYDAVDLALSTMGGTIGQVLSAGRHISDPYDKRYTPVSDMASTIWYMMTGAPIRDKTQNAAIQAYINGDVDFLLTLSDIQLNAFFKRAGTWKNELNLSKKSLEMAKVAKDMGLYGWSYEKDPTKAILQALTWLGIHENVVWWKQYKEATDDMTHLLELVLWDQFDYKGSSDGFAKFINNCKTFIDKKWSKEFERFNPVLYKNYKYYADNFDYYDNQAKYGKVVNEKGANSVDAIAMQFAIKYRFKWDEGMSVQEKTQAIISWKLKDVMFSPANEAAGVPRWITMTDGYWKHMDNKGYLVKHYLQSANEVIALNKTRSLFYSLAYAEKDKGNTKKSQEYFNKAKNIYNKEQEAYKYFHLHGDKTDFALFVLSKDGQSIQDKMNNVSGYINNQYKKDAKATTAKFDKLVAMTPKEREAFKNAFNTDVDLKINKMGREMLNDTANQNYAQTTRYPEFLKTILNQK